MRLASRSGFVLVAAIGWLVAPGCKEPVERPEPPASPERPEPSERPEPPEAAVEDASSVGSIAALCEAYRRATSPEDRLAIERRYELAVLDLTVREIEARIAEIAGDSDSSDSSDSSDGTVSVAVLDFVGPDRERVPGGEGALWAERLMSRLGKLPTCRVVAGADREAIEEELAATRDDVFEGRERPRIGRLRVPECLVLGMIGRVVLVKVLRTETGDLVASHESPRPYAPRPDATSSAGSAATLAAREQAVRRQLEVLRPERNAFDLRVWVDRGTVAVGEPVTFRVRAERDCFVTLLTLQQDGTLIQLLPNAYSGANRVRAGVDVAVPDDSAPWEIAASNPPGEQTVWAFATAEPVPVWSLPGAGAPPSASGGIRGTSDPDVAVQRTRDLKVRLKRRPGTFQAMATCAVRVVAER